MATRERLVRQIAELATRPRSVRFSEIERLVKQVGLVGGFSILSRPVNHGTMFRIKPDDGEAVRIQLTPHNDSDPHHVKKVYVVAFLEGMEKLGLYGDGDDDEEEDD